MPFPPIIFHYFDFPGPILFFSETVRLLSQKSGRNSLLERGECNALRLFKADLSLILSRRERESFRDAIRSPITHYEYRKIYILADPQPTLFEPSGGLKGSS